jgi:hypothetical protein
MLIISLVDSNCTSGKGIAPLDSIKPSTSSKSYGVKFFSLNSYLGLETDVLELTYVLVTELILGSLPFLNLDCSLALIASKTNDL